MMFFLIIISWSAMDGHSKREVIEVFNMNKKKVFARFLSSNLEPRKLEVQDLYGKK